MRGSGPSEGGRVRAGPHRARSQGAPPVQTRAGACARVLDACSACMHACGAARRAPAAEHLAVQLPVERRPAALGDAAARGRAADGVGGGKGQAEDGADGHDQRGRRLHAEATRRLRGAEVGVEVGRRVLAGCRRRHLARPSLRCAPSSCGFRGSGRMRRTCACWAAAAAWRAPPPLRPLKTGAHRDLGALHAQHAHDVGAIGGQADHEAGRTHDHDPDGGGRRRCGHCGARVGSGGRGGVGGEAGMRACMQLA